MENQEHKKTLVEYVAELIKNGINKKEIESRLLAVGWSEEQVELAYGKALIASGAPTPKNNDKSSVVGKKISVGEIAVKLFSFVLLAIVSISLGTLFNQIINKYIPDDLERGFKADVFSTEVIHYAIAALLIGFPIYYFTMFLWFRSFRKSEGKVETTSTKQLTYIVLLITSVLIVINLIRTVFTFLQGELSTRFFLKTLVILGISGIIFVFYFLERKKIQYKKEISRRVFQLFGAIVSIIVIIAIILGFVAGGLPSTERKKNLDKKRVQDLRIISDCIKRYAKHNNKLPQSLKEVRSASSCSIKKDPKTNKFYEYNVISDNLQNTEVNREAKFEVCANFSLNADEYNYFSDDSKWKHKAGRDCKTTKVKLKKDRN